MAQSDGTRKLTRIQREKRQIVFEAALDLFSAQGLHGTTLDQIAAKAGLSKPNLVYYFPGKEAIYIELLESLLDRWVSPLREISAQGDPVEELLTYARRKVAMSRDMPRESRLFASEILQGAPRLSAVIQGNLKYLVDAKTAILRAWIDQGRLAPLDPHHLIFSIWAMTQHYADFDMQVSALLGPERAPQRFEEAEIFVTDALRRIITP